MYLADFLHVITVLNTALNGGRLLSSRKNPPTWSSLKKNGCGMASEQFYLQRQILLGSYVFMRCKIWSANSSVFRWDTFSKLLPEKSLGFIEHVFLNLESIRTIERKVSWLFLSQSVSSFSQKYKQRFYELFNYLVVGAVLMFWKNSF